jgi:hypothetical protein
MFCDKPDIFSDIKNIGPYLVQPVHDSGDRHARLEGLDEDVGPAQLEDGDGEDDAGIAAEVGPELQQVLGLVRQIDLGSILGSSYGRNLRAKL